MDGFPCGVVLKDVVRRDRETGVARQVRVTVHGTKELGFCHRHACVDFNWAPDPNAPAHVAPVLQVTSGCGIAVGRPIWEGLMPSVATVVVTTVRVRHVAIARGRRVAIARGRHRRPGPSGPLRRRVPLPPRRLPCLGRRACATCAFARPLGLRCQRWRMPGWIK